jgi:multidrug efflux pump subunit AcrA (membrane-fusion protein)
MRLSEWVAAIEARRIPRRWLLLISFGVAAIGVLAAMLRIPAGHRDTLVPRTATVKKGSLESRVSLSGIVSPRRRTSVTAPYNGYVRKIFVKIGDSVTEGAPLVSITQSLRAGEAGYPLRAPFSGTVVQLEKSEGEFAKENDAKDLILRIDDLSQLLVVAHASELDRVRMHPGQTAEIRASAIPDRVYRGVVRSLSLSAMDPESSARLEVRFSTRIEVLDPDSRLQPGMSAIVDIVTARKDHVLVLGHEFIRRKNGQATVTLADGRVRPVELGFESDDLAEVVSGVGEGEVVRQVDYMQSQGEG